MKLIIRLRNRCIIPKQFINIKGNNGRRKVNEFH